METKSGDFGDEDFMQRVSLDPDPDRTGSVMTAPRSSARFQLNACQEASIRSTLVCGGTKFRDREIVASNFMPFNIVAGYLDISIFRPPSTSAVQPRGTCTVFPRVSIVCPWRKCQTNVSNAGRKSRARSKRNEHGDADDFGYSGRTRGKCEEWSRGLRQVHRRSILRRREYRLSALAPRAVPFPRGGGRGTEA